MRTKFCKDLRRIECNVAKVHEEVLIHLFNIFLAVFISCSKYNFRIFIIMESSQKTKDTTFTIKQHITNPSLITIPPKIVYTGKYDDIKLERRFGEGAKPLCDRHGIVVNQLSTNIDKPQKTHDSTSSQHKNKYFSSTDSSSPERYRQPRNSKKCSSSTNLFEKETIESHKCIPRNSKKFSTSTNSFEKVTIESHTCIPRNKNNTSSKINLNKNKPLRKSLSPLAKKKSHTDIPKAVEKKPYFRDEIRERDRLRRLYGNSVDKSPTSTKQNERRYRSTSRERHRQPSTYHHERFRGQNSRSRSRTRSRYKVDYRKEYDRRYDRSKEKYRSSREREYKSYRRDKEHRSSRERHHRLSTDRYHRASSERDYRSSMERYHRRSRERSYTSSREREHDRTSNKTERTISAVAITQPQIVHVPVPVMADFSMPLWPAQQQWAPPNHRPMVPMLPHSYAPYPMMFTPVRPPPPPHAFYGGIAQPPFSYGIPRMHYRHLRYPSSKYFVRGKKPS